MVANQKWAAVKSPAEIVLEDLDIDIEWADTSVNSVTIRDGRGHALRLLRGDYGGMRAMIPATAEKYRLFGEVCGCQINLVLDTEDEAEARKEELSRAHEKAVLTIEKVRVPA